MTTNQRQAHKVRSMLNSLHLNYSIGLEKDLAQLISCNRKSRRIEAKAQKKKNARPGELRG
jgi:hypothetical protein